eukprot:TRINITY_DN2317_c0_g1_i1.p1 TRINITY_DN2317_c0_g1~~TRINITY_DN2317_c0_g1_i1.p1  ORF type:complete len:843 (+),score=153.45 TRINITY_DN2317_c0_g1_i1:82-2610(+)
MSQITSAQTAVAVARKKRKTNSTTTLQSDNFWKLETVGSAKVTWRHERLAKIKLPLPIFAVQVNTAELEVRKTTKGELNSTVEMYVNSKANRETTLRLVASQPVTGIQLQYLLTVKIVGSHSPHLRTRITIPADLWTSIDNNYHFSSATITFPDQNNLKRRASPTLGPKLRNGKRAKTEINNALPVTTTTTTPEVPSEPFPFLELPPEVQLHIVECVEPFYSIPHLAQVCKAFKELVTQEFLWKNINQRFYGSPKAEDISWLRATREKTEAFTLRFGWRAFHIESMEMAEQQLCWASRHGHLSLISRVMSLYPNVKINGWYFQQESKLPASPLFLAAQQGHALVCELLISLGADVNGAAEDDESTPIYVAAFNGHAEVIKLLLKHGATVDSRRIDGSTPLSIAVRRGHADVVKVLIDNKADVNAPRNDGITPLYIAVWRGSVELTELLLRDGKADPNAAPIGDGATALYVATYGVHLEVVKVLLKYKANVNAQNVDGATAAYIAGFHGDTKILELLYQSGANLNLPRYDGMSPLAAAVQSDKIEAIKALISYGVNVNAARADGATPLYMTARKGAEEAMMVLLDAGNANVNLARFDGVTPLNVASQNGHTKVVKILIERGAHVNIAEHQGVTPLGIASQQGHLEIVNLLLSGADGVGERADPNIATNDFTTPIYLASQQGHDVIVQKLAERGADVNRSRQNGETPLHAASFRGHAKIVSILLKYGANPSVSRNDGITPLLLAVHGDRYEIAHILLTNEADVNAIRKSDGATPLIYAATQGPKRHQMTVLLLAYGANPHMKKFDGVTSAFTLIGEKEWPKIVDEVNALRAKHANLWPLPKLAF